MGKHIVFVYGSLLSGLHNHRVLAGAKALGAAQTAGLYQMRDLGYYPGVVYPGQLDHCCAIRGEIYEVDDDGLKRLDLLEGHPHFYRRELIRAEGDGCLWQVWMYVLQGDRRGHPIVHGGDWKAYLKAREEKEREQYALDRERCYAEEDDRETIAPGDARYYRPHGTADR